MCFILQYFRDVKRRRSERRRKRFFWPNDKAAKIIRDFMIGKDKYGNYDDLLSFSPHMNLSVRAAVELLIEFERRFPARHDRDYCDPAATPFFVAIADLLERNRLHVENVSDIECVDGEYPPKMKEFIKCVEDTVAANATVDNNVGGFYGSSAAKS